MTTSDSHQHTEDGWLEMSDGEKLYTKSWKVGKFFEAPGRFPAYPYDDRLDGSHTRCFCGTFVGLLKKR